MLSAGARSLSPAGEDLRVAGSLAVVSRVIGSGIRFLSVPLAMQLLSPAGYGLWLLISSVTSWIALADLGVPTAVQNLLISHLGKNDFEGARSLVLFSLKRLVAIGALIAAVLSGIVIFLPVSAWLKIPREIVVPFQVSLVASVATAGVLFATRLGPAIAFAHQLSSAPSYAEMAGAILSFATLLGIYLLGWGSLGAMVVIQAIGQVTGMAALMVWVLRRQRYLAGGPSKPVCPTIKAQLLGTSGFFFVNVLGELLIFQSQNLLVSAAFGPTVVPQVGVPLIIFTNLIMLQAVVLRTVAPRIRMFYATARPSQGQALIHKCINISVISGLIAGTGTYLMGPWFISVWTHGAVEMGPVMRAGLSLLVVVGFVDNPIAAILIATDRIKQRCFATFAFGAIQAIAGFLFLPLLGAEWMPAIGAGAMLCGGLVPSVLALRRVLRG